MCLYLAATSINAECASKNAPTTRVRLRIRTNNPLERIIRANLPPVGRGEGIVEKRLSNLLLLRGAAQLQLLEPRNHLRGFGLCGFAILLGVDRLEHQGDLG